jgi:hypothetical protein
VGAKGGSRREGSSHAPSALRPAAPDIAPPPHTHTRPQLPLPGGLIEDITLGGTSLLDAEHLDPHLLDKYFTLGDHPIRVAGMKVGGPWAAALSTG